MKQESDTIEQTAPATPLPDEFRRWPQVSEEEVEAVTRVLRSGKINYWTGDEGRSFEREFADFVGCRYAVAVTSGTVALEFALRALGIGPGDEVITTSRSFIASASCIVAVGARPVFADVDPDAQNITVESIRKAVTPRTRAIIAVHLAGWPCDMNSILQLTRELGLYCVEDCAQAKGAIYRGRYVGTFGDVGCFSFCQDKHITTGGEGGMVVTNSEPLWDFIWSYKDDGKNYHKAHAPRSAGLPLIRDRFGTNARLTEMQSALGRVGLRRLPAQLAIRRAHAAKMTERLSVIAALRVPTPPSHIVHAYYRFSVFVRPELLGTEWSRNRIVEEINAAEVPCIAGGCSELYLEDAVPSEWRPDARLPVARELGETSLAFFVHPTLTEAHINRTCDVVEEVMQRASQEQR